MTQSTAARPALPSALELIEGWKWFAYVPPEARQWLADHASVMSMHKGQIVYTSGNAATHIFAVTSGVFRIYMAAPNGHEITLEEVVRGGWFPHLAPGEKPVYIGNCVCLQDATVVAVPMKAVTEFAQRWPGFFQGVYHEFIDRMVVIFGRIELLSLHNLHVRLAVYLLRMAQIHGVRSADGSIWVAPAADQTEIGARVGGTRQRVNSILKSWSTKGIIELHKDGTRIRDIPRLTAEAKKSGFELEKYLAGWHGGWQGRK